MVKMVLLGLTPKFDSVLDPNPCGMSKGMWQFNLDIAATLSKCLHVIPIEAFSLLELCQNHPAVREWGNDSHWMSLIDVWGLYANPIAAKHAPTHPPPPCESNTKIPEFDRNNTSWCSDKGVVCAPCEKTQEVPIAS